MPGPGRPARVPGREVSCLARVILAGPGHVGPANLSRYTVIPQKNTVDKVIFYSYFFRGLSLGAGWAVVDS